VTKAAKDANIPPTESLCPVKNRASWGFFSKGNDEKSKDVYNVYAKKIDPSNQMPSKADQAMAPGQTKPLSKERVVSAIPKGNTDQTWVYPSPQMFFNSLARKGKLGDMAEEDAEVVVAIHNNMNENTWSKILQWEQLAGMPWAMPSSSSSSSEGQEEGGAKKRPTLLKFMGRPFDLSPKAYLKKLLGHPEPFDRHDWIVERGGEEVRYVIDYYHDEGRSEGDEMPQHLQDQHSIKSILLDVRPALDGPWSVLARAFFMPALRLAGRSSFQPLPLLPSPQLRQQRKQMEEEDRQAAEAAQEQQKLSALASAVIENCQAPKLALQKCENEGGGDCTKQAIALTCCMASQIQDCSHKVKELHKHLEGSNEEMVDKLLVDMDTCVQNTFSSHK